MKETFHFSISSESVYNQLSDLFTMLVCGKFFYLFSDLCNVVRNLLQVRTNILAILNLWDMKSSLNNLVL